MLWLTYILLFPNVCTGNVVLMLKRIIAKIIAWLERRRNLHRIRRENSQYEAALGANLRYVEDFLRKRKNQGARH